MEVKAIIADITKLGSLVDAIVDAADICAKVLCSYKRELTRQLNYQASEGMNNNTH